MYYPYTIENMPSFMMVPNKQESFSFADNHGHELLFSTFAPVVDYQFIDSAYFDFLTPSPPPSYDMIYNEPVYNGIPMPITTESCSSLSSLSSGSPVSSPLCFDKPKNRKTKYPNDRPFSCHLCPRAFARKHDLQRHIRVHTGDKPYVCPCCKKGFARTDALKRHLRVEEQCRKSNEVQTMKETGKRRYKHL